MQINCCRDNHVQFIIFSVCISDTHAWETNECVCAEDYYQTTSANETVAAVCTACPPGSTTDGSRNSSACGKYGKNVIHIPKCSVRWNGLIIYFELFLMIESIFITKVVSVLKLVHTTNQWSYVIENKNVQTVLFIICAVHHYRFYRERLMKR